MKNKLLTVICLIFLCILFSSCKSTKDSMNWLEGDWSSSEWNLTYTFSQSDDIWTIKNGQEIISDTSEIKENSSNKNIVLMSKEGVQFKIEKKDATHIMFSQTVSGNNDAMVGTTNSVEFSKD